MVIQVFVTPFQLKSNLFLAVWSLPAVEMRESHSVIAMGLKAMAVASVAAFTFPT
jgi:hypothetical protein